jgi:transposase-like protein
MARNTNRGTLSEDERLQIQRLYAEGGHTYQSLASEYGVHKSTISRIVNGQNKKLKRAEQTQTTSAPAQTVIDSDAGVEHDPLLFRQAKLAEIAADIQATRDRGSQHALPQFHRLHLQVHDEWVQMKRDAEELDGVTNPDELLQTIAMTVKGLPPILKDRLIDMLEGGHLQVYDGGAE